MYIPNIFVKKKLLKYFFHLKTFFNGFRNPNSKFEY